MPATSFLRFCWSNSDTPRFIVFLVLLAFFVVNIHTGFVTFLNRQQFSSGDSNTLCQPGSTKWKKNEDIVGHVCNNPPAELGLQFDRFLWFLSDGLPVKYSEETFEHFKSHGVLYTVDLPGPKYSHAIYTSYLTGQLPTNYKGLPIKGDSLIRSIKRSPYFGNLTYVGPEWRFSFLAITSPKSEYPQNFASIHDIPEPLNVHHAHAYPFFFETGKERLWFWNDLLPKLAREKGSLLTHSAIFDHASHGVFRNPPPNIKRLETLSKTIARDMNSLKDWIDKNPDYLLILSSDHGHDDIEKGYVLHGYSTKKNEGYVFLYNPRLTSYSKRVDIVDICPTLSNFMRGVDIPADSIGRTNVYWGENQLAFRAVSLQQNIAQLRDTSRKRGIVLDSGRIKSNLAAKVKTQRNADDTEDAFLEESKKMVDRFERTSQYLKNKLYSLVHAPWGMVATHFLITACIMAFIIYKYNFEFIELVIFRKWRTCLGILSLFCIIYFGMFMNIMLWNEGWGGVFDGGSVFFIWQQGLTLVIFYILLKLSTMSGSTTPSSGSGSQSAYRTNLISEAAWVLFINTIIDVFTDLLKWMFRKDWKEVFKISSSCNFIIYVLLIWWIFDFLGFSLLGLLRRILCFWTVFQRRSNHTVSPFSPRSGTSAPSDSALALPKKRGPQFTDLGHLIAALAMVYLVANFDLTSDKATYIHLYSFHSFHKYYASFLFCAAAYSAYVILFRFDALHFLTIPMSMFAFSLLQDTPHVRLLLVVFNWQYSGLLLPLFRNISALCHQNRINNTTAHKTQASRLFDDVDEMMLDGRAPSTNGSEPSDMRYDGDKTPATRRSKIAQILTTQYWNLLLQAVVFLILNQPFYQFYVGCEERLNIDAHPFAGGVGLITFDIYPNWSAIQMAYEKNFLFFIFLLHLWHILHRDHNDSSRELSTTVSSAGKGKAAAVSTVPQTSLRILDHTAGLVATLITLFSNNTMFFLYLLMCFISRRSAFEQAFVYLVVAALFGLWFVFTFMLSRLHNYIFQSRGFWGFVLSGSAAEMLRSLFRPGSSVLTNPLPFVLPSTRSHDHLV